MWEHVVHHAVHEHEVNASVCICAHAEVFIVVSSERHLQTVVMVHHTGDTVKAESVKLEFIKPVARVAHEEAQCFPVAVVEAP